MSNPFFKIIRIDQQNSGRVGNLEKISTSKGPETKSKKLLFTRLEGDHK
jgi:hypothetical protein